MLLSLKSRLRNVLEAAQGKEQVLSSREIMAATYNGPEDVIIENEGVEGYFKMLRDAKVSANVDGVVSLAIPGISTNPGDDTDKGIRNADFVRDVLEAIPGSTIDSIRQLFKNAIVTGLFVGENQYEIMTLPEWGTVNGITAINLKPTCSFTNSMNGIKVDRFGNILEFQQDGTHGGNTATLDEVIYYAFRGNANNRYGTSLLHSVYDPWKGKQKIFRIYAMFMATNASGTRVAKVPNNSTKKQLQDAQATMRKLATAQSFAVIKDWEIDVDKPGSGTGGHFLEMMQEMDRQIDTGIYGDSAFSAQDQGSYASRSVSQSNVQSRMRAWGDAFMEAFSEQFCTQLLRENGFDGPLPRITADMVEDAGSRIEKYKVLGDLKQKQVITVALPDEAQKKVMQDLGIAAEDLVDATTPEAKAEPVIEPKPEVRASELIHAAAPSGRDNATLKRNGKQYDTLAKDGAKDLSNTWQSIVPQIMKKIDGQVFNPKLNGWKVTDLTKLRQIAVETVKYKSSDMRKSMDATLRSGDELGQKHVQSMLPVEAAAGFTPRAAIQSLQNHTFLTLEKKYPQIAEQVYYQLEAGIRGDLAPNVVRANIQDYLVNGSVYTPGLANTIIETSLSSAYNDARMSLFRQVVDVTGNTPGGIIGYVFSAIMDDFTTDICSSFDGKAFRADDPSLPQPPLHFNCRSQLIPVFAGEEPWTKESGGEFTSPADSKAMVATAQANGEIQKGFM